MNILSLIKKEYNIIIKEENILDNPEILQYFDIISTNPDKYKKYIAVLKNKYNVDFYDYYNDDIFIKKANLNDIKSEKDFLSFDNYIKYAKRIFNLRKIPLPTYVDKTVDSKYITLLGKKLGFNVNVKEYNDYDNYNYASFGLTNKTITIPSIVDINTLIHEIGHFFDYTTKYEGLAKTITMASSSYLIDKKDEVFAENFLHYFIVPNLLKKYLPEVYNELDKKIPSIIKNELNSLIKK